MSSKCQWHLCQIQTTKTFCSRNCATKHAVTNRRTAVRIMAFFYKGQKCMACGYSKYRSAMQYLPLSPEQKDFGIGHGNTLSWETIKKELDKCILLCANCHAGYHTGHLDLSEALARNPTPEQGEIALQQMYFDVIGTPDEQYIASIRRKGPPCLCKDCGIQIQDGAQKCVQCHNKSRPTKIEWPSREVLLEMLSTRTRVEVARILGVSDNAIKKHLKKTVAPDPDTGTTG